MSANNGRPSDAAKTQRAEYRFHTLDGMRGIAALAVVLFHIGWLIGVPAMREGYLAVDFFFALSGFVLGGAYEQRLRDGLTFKAFAVVRILRLYPLYLVGLSIGLVKGAAQIVKHDDLALSVPAYAGSAATGFFMLPSPFSTRFTFPFNPPSWSLFDELLINLVFAALLFRAKTRVLAMLATIAAVGLATDTHGNAFAGDDWAGLTHGLIRVTFAFTMGLLIRRVTRPERRQTWLALAPVAVLVILLCPTIPAEIASAYDLTASLILIPSILYAGTVLEVPPIVRPGFAFLGDVSYPLYAVHLPIVGISWFLLRHDVAPIAFMTILPIALVAIAWLLARYFDAPVRYWAGRALKIRASAKLQSTTSD